MNLRSDIDTFWNSLHILITKPHVVNKRLWGQKIIKTTYYKSPSLNTKCDIPKLQLKDVENIEGYLKNVAITMGLQCSCKSDYDVELIMVKFLPKCYHEERAYQIILLLRKRAEAIFYNVTPKEIDQNLCPNFNYSLCMDNNDIRIKSDEDDNKTLWLRTTVLPQVVKWAEQTMAEDRKNCKTLQLDTLSLVPHYEYYELYNELKLKYGKKLVEMWPECTDPLKFVYEDIAIATYLILYWQHLNGKSQSFIDIGCGNGLLVYILVMEGHTGIGLDVRKRKIWDMYPNNIKLQEHTVKPNEDVYPEADWIIGNHSDELTPWIPIIAAKSSYKCNFFLLPCCPYNFDGTKYQRQNSSMSQYTEYIDKIHKLCEESRFVVKKDRLKIPSTKRICFISNSRIYLKEDYHEYLDSTLKLVIEHSDLTGNYNTNNKEIKTRNPIERVKNCTQVDKTIINSIIMCITRYLLKDIDLTSNWTSGRTIKIYELIDILPSEKLNALKSECGGLQTLLRNNHQIFEVKGGNVKIRYPKTIDEVKANMKKMKKSNDIKMQIKKCWFYNNHPQGCPLPSNSCSFLHSM